MAQVTWRAPDELVEQVRLVAQGEARSMNDYITRVLDAATNPDLAEGESERLRERLRKAGLLAPAGSPRARPDEKAVARARKAAGKGTALSTLVARDRG